MEERSQGLILRTRPLTDTSLIVEWLSGDLGRLSTVAKGARRPKSSFLGKLDLFYAAEFTFRRSRRSTLHTLGEVKVTGRHDALRLELKRLEVAAYFSRLIEATTETETPLPGLFQQMSEALRFLQGHQARAGLVFAFELRMLVDFGLQPDWSQTRLASAVCKQMEDLSAMPLDAEAGLRLDPAHLIEIDRFLRHFLQANLDRIPWKARDAALAGLI